MAKRFSGRQGPHQGHAEDRPAGEAHDRRCHQAQVDRGRKFPLHLISFVLKC